MARTSSTVSVSTRDLISTITLRVRFAAPARLRLRVAAMLMKGAARVAGCGIEIEPHDEELRLTSDGMPRALSILQGFKGYRRDAMDIGHDLVIRLDGIEQRDVVSFDIDERRVSSYARDDDDGFRLCRIGPDDVPGPAIRHRKGIVTVERKLA